MYRIYAIELWNLIFPITIAQMILYTVCVRVRVRCKYLRQMFENDWNSIIFVIATNADINLNIVFYSTSYCIPKDGKNGIYSGIIHKNRMSITYFIFIQIGFDILFLCLLSYT